MMHAQTQATVNMTTATPTVAGQVGTLSNVMNAPTAETPIVHPATVACSAGAAVLTGGAMVEGDDVVSFMELTMRRSG